MIPNTVLTDDGSITCLDRDSGELYHNRAGAYSEALKNYVQACDLADRLYRQAKVLVLDVCFGLGYNTFVFLDYFLQQIERLSTKHDEMLCHIVGIDWDSEILAVVPEVLADFRFMEFCQKLNWTPDAIRQMILDWQKYGKHQIKFSGETKLVIEIEMKFADLRKTVPELAGQGHHFDYIFHDGFSPRSMPELWTVDLFREYAKMIGHDGRIITYSSAAAVRGAFKECGLQVRKSIALGGKSGGTVAFLSAREEIADNESIFFLTEEEYKRLNSRSAIPYRDPQFKDTPAQIIQRRALELKQSKLAVYRSSKR